MKFFTIPPLSDLPLMHAGTAGYFLLAHLYMSDKTYRDFVQKEIPKGAHVILDNGAAENSLVTEDILIDLVKEIKPTEVIAPDVLFDMDHTINNTVAFTDRMIQEKLDKDTNIFFCPQGSTIPEWLQAYEFGMENDLVSTIGLSKIAVPYAFFGAKNDTKIAESRHMAIEVLHRLGWIRKPIHFLGMGDPREFDYYNHVVYLNNLEKTFLRSTDSCYSILAGMKGVNFKDGNFERIPTPHDYFQTAPGYKQYNDIHSNIDWMRARLS